MDFVKELQSITKPVFLMDEEEIAPHDRFLNGEDESKDSSPSSGGERDLEIKSSDGVTYAGSASSDDDVLEDELIGIIADDGDNDNDDDINVDDIDLAKMLAASSSSQDLPHDDTDKITTTSRKDEEDELEKAESLLESLSQESTVSLHSNTSDRSPGSRPPQDVIIDHDVDESQLIKRQSSERFPVLLHNPANNTILSDTLHLSGSLAVSLGFHIRSVSCPVEYPLVNHLVNDSS